MNEIPISKVAQQLAEEEPTNNQKIRSDINVIVTEAFHLDRELKAIVQVMARAKESGEADPDVFARVLGMGDRVKRIQETIASLGQKF